jgi:tripartite-type tricarboxylate transporter receptor subunit TctC
MFLLALALRAIALSAIVIVIVATASLPAGAQDWPTRPIRILVGFGAGGGTDIAARIIAEPLQEILGQSVVVENRPGAGGMTAAAAVAKAPKDGYTVLMMSNAHVIAPVMYKSVPYDAVNDFQMISMLGTAGLLLVTHPDFPANNLQEMISLLKANPGKYNFASSGAGTTQHFSGELMNQMAGTNVTHVPFRSTPAALSALLGNQVHMVFELIQPVLPQVRAGTLKAIAVTSPQPFPSVPEVPTFAAAGLAGYDVTSWYGLSLPAGTPEPIVQKMSKAVQEALGRESVRQQILDAGALPRTSSSEELKNHVATEIAKWETVRDKAGMQPQ